MAYSLALVAFPILNAIGKLAVIARCNDAANGIDALAVHNVPGSHASGLPPFRTGRGLTVINCKTAMTSLTAFSKDMEVYM